MKRFPVLAVSTLACAMAWAGCDELPPARQADQPAAAVTRTSGREAATPTPAMDTRTQYDLAREIAAAEAMPRDEAAPRMLEIRRDWIGKRYQWKVDVIHAVCASAESCHVLPFDAGGADRKIVQGWMPQLALTEEAFAAIERTCKDADRCTITFQGTLSKLVLSTEDLTSLGFTDVAIL